MCVGKREIERGEGRVKKGGGRGRGRRQINETPMAKCEGVDWVIYSRTMAFLRDSGLTLLIISDIYKFKLLRQWSLIF